MSNSPTRCSFIIEDLFSPTRQAVSLRQRDNGVDICINNHRLFCLLNTGEINVYPLPHYNTSIVRDDDEGAEDYPKIYYTEEKTS